MIVSDLVEEIKVDLGSDVNSLGISDSSIEMKIEEALRKISVYAPYIEIGQFDVVNNTVELPVDTIMVAEILTTPGIVKDQHNMELDTDLFSASRYLYNYNDLSDPFIYLMQRNSLNTIKNFVSMSDYTFNRSTRKLYFANFNSNKVTVKYLRKYRTVDEIIDDDILQRVKEYALALCKIIEGNIRRKLSNAPGAIPMDGDSLVSEGLGEKASIEEKLIREFRNLRFGRRS